MTDIYFDFFFICLASLWRKRCERMALKPEVEKVRQRIGEEGMLERYGRICFVAEKKKNINKDSSTLLRMHFCNAKSVLLATVIKS